MISTALLAWFSSDQGLMALLSHNWPLGILMVAAIVFVETGLVFMPFLPGDSLLFATGALLGLAGLSPLIPIAIASVAAIAGDATNYAIGRSRLGQQIVRRGWISPRHLERTQAWFERYGGPTITIGRFFPVVRTVAPFMAGLAGLDAKRFLAYNIAGGIVWSGLLMSAGYWLGQVAWVREHLHWLSLGIVALSLLPVLIHLANERAQTRNKEPARASAVGRG